MPGQLNKSDGSYVTRLRSYRQNILNADDAETLLDHSGDPVANLDMRHARDLANGSYLPNKYGADLVLFVYAEVRGLQQATLELWMHNPPLDENQESDSSYSPESSSSGDREEFWFKIDSQNISDQERIVFDQLVPGVYRILVTSITPDAGEEAAIDLYEQHTE